MSFLGIGLPEVVLVVIIAAIVVGPQRLPEVAVQLARAIRYLRGYATDATAQLRAEIDELTRDYQQVRQELQEFRQSVGGNLSAIGKDLSSITEEVDRTLKESQPIIEPPGEPPPKERQPPASTS